MAGELDYSRLLAGLGLFLFGMNQLEHALQSLAGRSFKRFLKTHTSPPVKGAITGALATAVLQSSSIVSLIVLAFVGTGILSLASALGIVFGANLGTTATGWIVATLGFKLDIEALSLPLIALGGAGVVWSARESKFAFAAHLVVGFGLMLMGLEFMKSGATQASAWFDPAALSARPAIVFLLAGLLLTAVVQSSSATIMITLSALYAGLIPLSSAAAAAIGADLGTTITAVLGAIAGSPSKKRVAAAIVIFNVVTDAIAFVFLHPLLGFVSNTLSIADPLFALVAFHSLFNLVGVVLFLPIVSPFGRFLERHFTSGGGNRLRYISRQDLAAPEVAISNIARETQRLIDRVAALNQASFQLAPVHSFHDEEDRHGAGVAGAELNLDEAYSAVKELEGDILEFALLVQEAPLDATEAKRLAQLIPAVRNAVHAAKSIRDTRHDLRVFQESENDAFHGYFGKFRDSVSTFYSEFSGLPGEQEPQLTPDILSDLNERNGELLSSMHSEIYRQVRGGELNRMQISTLLNVNREIYSANQSLLQALAETEPGAG